MSFTQRILACLEANMWKFVRLIHSSNRDFPYHDYVAIVNESDQDALVGSYAVGTNNVNLHGDQSKFFVSKRANIWATSPNTLIRFNDSRNVPITLPPKLLLVDDTVYIAEKEFHTNIAVVYYEVMPTSILFMYFEGVLPEEARDAE